MIILNCVFAELEKMPEFPALVEEYYSEAGNPGLPRPKYDSERYGQLCKLGLMHTFGVTVDGRLIGFMMIVVSVLPKYSLPVATLDTIFVGKAHRMSGAGVRLLQRAEQIAADLADGRLLASSPVEGALANLLERSGYLESNRIFFKQVAA